MGFCGSDLQSGSKSDVFLRVWPSIRKLFVTLEWFEVAKMTCFCGPGHQSGRYSVYCIDMRKQKWCVFVGLPVNPDAICYTLVNCGCKTDVFWWACPSIRMLFATLYWHQLTNVTCFFFVSHHKMAIWDEETQKKPPREPGRQSERYLLHFRGMG